MGRTLRTIAGLILIGVITCCAIFICQGLGKGLRIDITDQKLYTLSDGTKKILGKLNQPLKLRLYYTRTAARKAPDQIRYYNNYFYFVRALLEEYAKAAKGMVKLEVIDPRPYSDEEEEALRYGLRRFPMPDEEIFFFGLVLQTEFGVIKTIPFFAPARQNFVEYDISQLIDTAITREKKRIGILSSLPVMGEEVTGYMAWLMQQQNQQPAQPWIIVRQLQQQYEVKKIETDANDIKDVDTLLVIHPKELAEKTLFAIDQFVMRGGRAIIFVDPRCMADNPRRMPGQMGPSTNPTSDLNTLLRTWGVEMPGDRFAGDRSLALEGPGEDGRVHRFIGFLALTDKCLSTDNIITANLEQVRVLFAGALQKVTSGESEKENQIVPLLQTTNRGNTWRVAGPWDWIRINWETMMGYFTEGIEPVVVSYLITGRFKSAFPEGIEVPDESDMSDEDEAEKEEDDSQAGGESEEKTLTKKLTGLKEASTDCAVIVLSDVDFISDIEPVAYQNTIFGKATVSNNSDFLLNAIEYLAGSSDLIGIRSRGDFQRPFVVVREIKARAEEETAQEIARRNAEIEALRRELEAMVSKAKKGEESIVAASVEKKRREAALKIRKAERELKDIRKKRFEKIDQLGSLLQNLNTCVAPAGTLLIAVFLSIRRSVLRRRYVSHASDA
jgi:ABC-type uncharacterized transport system involved in gliding motility auxiliary subunit